MEKGELHMNNVSDVMVVGGGIGGLAAALGVVESGKSVAVLEQAPEFGEVGAGIQLAPNNAAFGLVGGQRNLPRDIQIGGRFTF